MGTLLDFLGYTACWWAAILGAANGRAWAGPAAAVVYLALHLRFLDRSEGAKRRILKAIAVGAVVEELNLLMGVVVYDATPFDLAVVPPWMITLWAAFAAACGVSMAWLRGRTLLAAVLGAVAGPLAYLGGARLGAMELGPGWVAVLAVEWAAATAWLTRKPEGKG